MHTQSARVLLLALLAGACSDTDARLSPTEPAFVGRASGIRLDGSSLSAQLVSGSNCPSLPPFLVPFTVVVGGQPAFEVAMSTVRMRFRDARGIEMPQVTLTQPALTAQFATTTVAAGGSRSFPFVFRFGCATARAGTLIVIVDTRDDRGSVTSTELRATVQ